MPPKTPVSSKGPSKQELDAINTYLYRKPDFDKLIHEAKQNPPKRLEEKETDYDRKLNEAVKQSLEEARQAQASRAQ